MKPMKPLEQFIKNNIQEKIKDIKYFKTWFNENLAIVIILITGNPFKKYEATLIIHEPAERMMNRIFIILKCIAKTKLPFDINNINPDEYIKPLDIIKIKRGGYKHVAIYLIDGKVCQIDGARGNSGGLFKKLNSGGVRIADWKSFLGDNPGEVTRYHVLIPFKRKEKIIEHIEKALLSKYGEGEYHLLLKNCEHFANMCVYSINRSEQVEKLKKYLIGVKRKENNNIYKNNILDINKSDKMFTNLKVSRELTIEEKQIIEELRRSTKVETIKETSKGWFSFRKIFKIVSCIFRRT
ncbi:14534_t:CDS:2 [Rhizophagus irregularis]|nr:14534_t:CDS:2 [Rhizophagus irregularis]